MQEKCLERIDELDDELKVVEMPLLVEEVRGKAKLGGGGGEHFRRSGNSLPETGNLAVSLDGPVFSFLRNAAFQRSKFQRACCCILSWATRARLIFKVEVNLV